MRERIGKMNSNRKSLPFWKVGIVLLAFLLLIVFMFFGYTFNALHYGKWILVCLGLKYALLFILMVLAAFFTFKNFSNFNNYSKFTTALFGVTFIVLAVVMAGDVGLVIIDAKNGPKTMYLTDTSYNRDERHRSFDHDELLGKCDGRGYKFDITGCDYDMINEIASNHPTVEVTYYERSRGVYSIKIIDK